MYLITWLKAIGNAFCLHKPKTISSFLVYFHSEAHCSWRGVLFYRHLFYNGGLWGIGLLSHILTGCHWAPIFRRYSPLPFSKSLSLWEMRKKNKHKRNTSRVATHTLKMANYSHTKLFGNGICLNMLAALTLTFAEIWAISMAELSTTWTLSLYLTSWLWLVKRNETEPISEWELVEQDISSSTLEWRGTYTAL